MDFDDYLDEEDDVQKNEYAIFQVKTTQYAIPITKVREFIKVPTNLTFVPDSDE